MTIEGLCEIERILQVPSCSTEIQTVFNKAYALSGRYDYTDKAYCGRKASSECFHVCTCHLLSLTRDTLVSPEKAWEVVCKGHLSRFCRPQQPTNGVVLKKSAPYILRSKHEYEVVSSTALIWQGGANQASLHLFLAHLQYKHLHINLLSQQYGQQFDWPRIENVLEQSQHVLDETEYAQMSSNIVKKEKQTYKMNTTFQLAGCMCLEVVYVRNDTTHMTARQSGRVAPTYIHRENDIEDAVSSSRSISTCRVFALCTDGFQLYSIVEEEPETQICVKEQVVGAKIVIRKPVISVSCTADDVAQYLIHIDAQTAVSVHFTKMPIQSKLITDQCKVQVQFYSRFDKFNSVTHSNYLTVRIPMSLLHYLTFHDKAGHLKNTAQLINSLCIGYVSILELGPPQFTDVGVPVVYVCSMREAQQLIQSQGLERIKRTLSTKKQGKDEGNMLQQQQSWELSLKEFSKDVKGTAYPFLSSRVDLKGTCGDDDDVDNDSNSNDTSLTATKTTAQDTYYANQVDSSDSIKKVVAPFPWMVLKGERQNNDDMDQDTKVQQHAMKPEKKEKTVTKSGFISSSSPPISVASNSPPTHDVNGVLYEKTTLKPRNMSNFIYHHSFSSLLTCSMFRPQRYVAQVADLNLFPHEKSFRQVFILKETIEQVDGLQSLQQLQQQGGLNIPSARNAQKVSTSITQNAANVGKDASKISVFASHRVTEALLLSLRDQDQQLKSNPTQVKERLIALKKRCQGRSVECVIKPCPKGVEDQVLSGQQYGVKVYDKALPRVFALVGFDTVKFNELIDPYYG